MFVCFNSELSGAALIFAFLIVYAHYSSVKKSDNVQIRRQPSSEKKFFFKFLTTLF